MTFNGKRIAPVLLLLATLFLLPAASLPVFASAQQSSSDSAKGAPENTTPGAELAKETREAAGEEENENLKHSPVVQKLAKMTGLSDHQVHLLATVFNFLLVVFLIYWLARKAVPAALRSRTDSIQRALEEARAASQDANQRLAQIEARLSKLDVEIAQMQASAEKEAQAEEVRVQQAAEADIRKIVQSAEQEIVSAAKQVRRELMTYTADLAVALARKQIHVDAATDQALVSNFAGNLSSGGGKDRA